MTIAALACTPAYGQFSQIVTYEGNVFPEEVGWQRLPAGPAQGERTLEDGWFIQTMSFPGQSSFRTELDWAVGVDAFFVEWRAITDNPAWLIDEWQVPTVVSAAGRASSFYHTVMTESEAVLLRDVSIPRVITPLSVGDAHIYRVEVFPDEYIWYVDGGVIDAGVPEGLYPDPDAFLIWGVEVTYDGAPAATTAWDYVRTGRIPFDASGDYDTDFDVDLTDYYFVHDCLTQDGPGLYGGPVAAAGDSPGSGPGCAFTDFPESGDPDGDGPDGDVDLRDFAAFQNQFVICVCCNPPVCDLICCP